MSGYTSQELMGHCLDELLGGNPNIQCNEDSEFKKGAKDASTSYEIKVEIKGGEERFWLVSSRPAL